MKINTLIILDRDGVLNKLLIDTNGNIDSPMSINQIEVFSWVPSCLKELNELGYGLVIATNQPAAAKGKISYDELYDVHLEIINQTKFDGADILESYICWHRSEDNCECRKPKTKLLQTAFNDYPKFISSESWMVGDRATDILAGHSFGMKTALLGPLIQIDEKILEQYSWDPNYRGADLRDFVEFIKRQ